MELNSGDTAWMLAASALVLLMTPGLALFYGGMVRAKSVLNMIMMSFGAMGVVGVIYVLWGYPMAFGDHDIGGFFSNPFANWALSGIAFGSDGTPLVNDSGMPNLILVGFQATFAIITVALISGAVADRVKFSTWIVFSAIWVTIVYFPLSHMVWGGGNLSADGWFTSGDVVPIDFAGGTVVHMDAGIAGLMIALLVGVRKGFAKVAMRPHNVPLVMLGAGLLWFGWFGFNAGSELAADGTAALAWVNTSTATSAALLGWLIVEKIRDGKPTSVGAASGAVAGLVAITPACAALTPTGSIGLGLIAGALCAWAVGLKYRFGYDDSLDVVGVHLVGGFWGTIGIGFFAKDTGLLYGGGLTQLWIQAAVALCALVFSGVLSLLIGLALKYTMGWRISEDDEVAGIDQAEHAESGYDLGGFGAGVGAASVPHNKAGASAQVEGANA